MTDPETPKTAFAAFPGWHAANVLPLPLYGRAPNTMTEVARRAFFAGWNASAATSREELIREWADHLLLEGDDRERFLDKPHQFMWDMKKQLAALLSEGETHHE